MGIGITLGGSAEASTRPLRGPDHYRAADQFYGAKLPENVRQVARRGTAERHRFINGVFIHQWKVRKHSPDRFKHGYHLFVRKVSNLWAEYERRTVKLGDGPWDAKDRIIIDCRNFSMLDASLLRSVGMPARVRNGFASYVSEGYLHDHWVCERWEGYRWVADDPDIQKLYVGDNEFYSSVRAWILSREDPAFADRCGYGTNDGDRGMWAVLLGAVRDLAALAGQVCVSGDSWGLGNKKIAELSAEDYALLDDLCARAVADEDLNLPAEVSMPQRIGNYDYIVNESRELNWADED